MSEPSNPPFAAAPPRRRRRWLRWLILLAIPPLLFVGYFFYSKHMAAKELEAVIAEMDRLDPTWRIEDIERERAKLPDEQNAAIPLKKAFALLGKPGKTAISNLDKFKPTMRIDPVLVGPLKEGAEPYWPVVSLAKEAIPFKSGYFPVSTSRPIKNVTPYQDLLKLGDLLHYLAVLQIEDGKSEDAWQTALAILAAARALGEEPSLMGVIVRANLWLATTRTLQRHLAQGTASDEELAFAQRQLAEEASQPFFYFAMRGERAGVHLVFNALEKGTMTLDEFASQHGPHARILILLSGGDFKKDHANILRYYNQAVEASRLPPAQVHAFFQGIDKQSEAESSLLSRQLFVTHYTVYASVYPIQPKAQLHCAIAGLGVERFRVKRGKWPDSLDDVVEAKLLDKVPDDPFTGKPLQYRKTADGVVVFSVCSNGDYKGDRWDSDNLKGVKGEIAEFRLWDEPHRRQPFVSGDKSEAKVNGKNFP